MCPGVSSEEQGMLVKQGFPLHGKGVVGQLQDPSLSKELSRIVTSQGAVIRCMKDGSTEVNKLYTHIYRGGHTSICTTDLLYKLYRQS